MLNTRSFYFRQFFTVFTLKTVDTRARTSKIAIFEVFDQSKALLVHIIV